MRARAVVLDFFGTLARATTSVGIEEVVARHGHTIPEHLAEMWWSGDIDGTEHVEQSRSRDDYLAWQQDRLVAMLRLADIHPGEHDAIIADLQAGRALRVLEAYDEVPEVLTELRDRGHYLAVCSNWDWDLEPASPRQDSRAGSTMCCRRRGRARASPTRGSTATCSSRAVSIPRRSCSWATRGDPTSRARSPLG
jgi:FMN phosphatase YigB (HAD superfamily)